MLARQKKITDNLFCVKEYEKATALRAFANRTWQTDILFHYFCMMNGICFTPVPFDK